MLRKEREKKNRVKVRVLRERDAVNKRIATTEFLKERQASISTKGVFSF